MGLTRIVVAADKSEAGRQAARTALEIARKSSARVTLLHVVMARAMAGIPSTADTGAFPREEDTDPSHEVRIAYGLPGIEICRFAEESSAGLIVLGRKHHSERARLLLGDTGDAVARRSRVPTLLVPEGETRLRRLLVALDGSQRGMSVLEHACDFARAVAMSVQVVTVARAAVIPGGGSLQGQVSETLRRKGMPDSTIITRSGSIVEEVLAEVEGSDTDVLAIGHHRGGQPWAVQASSTAQGLSHAAPCAVLTTPL